MAPWPRGAGGPAAAASARGTTDRGPADHGSRHLTRAETRPSSGGPPGHRAPPRQRSGRRDRQHRRHPTAAVPPPRVPIDTSRRHTQPTNCPGTSHPPTAPGSSPRPAAANCPGTSHPPTAPAAHPPPGRQLPPAARTRQLPRQPAPANCPGSPPRPAVANCPGTSHPPTAPAVHPAPRQPTAPAPHHPQLPRQLTPPPATRLPRRPIPPPASQLPATSSARRSTPPHRQPAPTGGSAGGHLRAAMSGLLAPAGTPARAVRPRGRPRSRRGGGRGAAGRRRGPHRGAARWGCRPGRWCRCPRPCPWCARRSTGRAGATGC